MHARTCRLIDLVDMSHVADMSHFLASCASPSPPATSLVCCLRATACARCGYAGWRRLIDSATLATPSIFRSLLLGP